jgi:hypothetical protein
VLVCALIVNDVNSTAAARIMDFMLQLPFSSEEQKKYSDKVSSLCPELLDCC